MLCYKNVGRPLVVTVSNGPRTQKDIMKLLCIFAAVLAFALAENDVEKKIYDDLEAAETMELMKEGVDLKSAASTYYIPPSQRPQQSWNPPSNYIPQNTWNQEKPFNNYVPPPSPIKPPQNDYIPQNQYVPPHQTYPPTWSTPHYHPQTTTTPVPVIKNEIFYGDNGSYKYEYQIGDGTHVGEEGYFTDPKGTEESLVKKGWYSYVGADGKVYTVTYWADKTGYHAYGDHLPTPPPVPPAIQAALDQNAKEEAEKNKPGYYPTQAPTYYPTQAPTYYPTHAPTYYPTQAPTYYPTQAPTHYPQQNYPSYGKK